MSNLATSQGITAALASPLENFFAGDQSNRNGIRVAAKSLNGDGRSGQLTGYNGANGTQLFLISATDDKSSTDGIDVG